MLSRTGRWITQTFRSFNTTPVVIRALSWTPSVNSRNRQQGHYMVKSQEKAKRIGLNHSLYVPSAEDAENLEALEDFINQDGIQQGHGRHLEQKTSALLQRQMVQQQRKVKKKIVERKHFKQQQEVNLLTWRAKQQLVYLHQLCPEEWTVEQLADSFPISQGGVRKLLASSYTPRSEREIERHDKRVHTHWRQLKQTLAVEGGPVEESRTHKFQHVIDAGKLPLMINAGGCSQLPQPRPVRKIASQRGRKMGVFEAIVAGSTSVKDQEMAVQTKVEGLQADSDKLLKELSGFSENKDRKGIPAHFSHPQRTKR